MGRRELVSLLVATEGFHSGFGDVSPCDQREDAAPPSGRRGGAARARPAHAQCRARAWPGAARPLRIPARLMAAPAAPGVTVLKGESGSAARPGLGGAREGSGTPEASRPPAGAGSVPSPGPCAPHVGRAGAGARSGGRFAPRAFA